MKMEPQDLIQDFEAGQNKYLMINVISRRSRALVDGEKPMIDPQGSTRPNEVAVQELSAGKLRVTPKVVRNKLIDIVREVTDRS